MSGDAATDGRFGVVIAGYGWWGKHIARRLRDHAQIRLVGVVEPAAPARAEIHDDGWAAFADLEPALARSAVDGVILATPTPLHEAQVVAAAAAGKHVFCEKPLGLTGASARRAVGACEEAGVQLGVGHERRFEPAMQALKATIEAGALGAIMHAEAAFSHDKLIGLPKDNWRTQKAVSPAAGMTGMGVHLTDLFIHFFGPVRTVQAMTADRSLGWQTGDVVTAQLGFAAGMTASLSAILHTPHFIRMHVFGSDKWIEVRNDTHPDTPGGQVQFVEAVSGAPPTLRVFEWTDAVLANIEAFVAAARGQAPYAFTPDEMAHNIEVLEAIARSAETGETVRIDPAPVA